MPGADDNILHEEDVESTVADHLEESGQVGFTHDAIADPASPGASYVQAEVVALRTAIVAILEALRANGIVAEA